MPDPGTSRRSWQGSALESARIVTARLRFFLMLGVVLAVVAGWPTLRNYWDRLTRPHGANPAISSDTEFWCPMCPGVLSDWPGKCPVCHMALIRRQKGEMTPLPDGVVARMQFSPYRVQLAGIRTSRIDYRPLTRDIALVGVLEARPDRPRQFVVNIELLDASQRWLSIGQRVEFKDEEVTGAVFPGQLVAVTPSARHLRASFEITDMNGDLRPGLVVTGVLRLPVANLPDHVRLTRDGWRDRTSARLAASALASPIGPPPGAGLEALLEQALVEAAQSRGVVPALPESAIIDTGARKVVFLERSPGMFEAVEVQLGRRCGFEYPLYDGVDLGESVVTAGSFLLDAETRLNPAAAASYFGANVRSGAAVATPPPLSSEEQRLVTRQKICPVTDEPLGSMGAPVRVVVDGRVVFVCCEGCTPALKKDSAKYLAKLPK